MKCARCGWKVLPLNLTEEQRSEIVGMMRRGRKLLAMQALSRDMGYQLAEAKGIVMHLNETFGRCVGCGKASLTEASEQCSQCGSFNYNLA